MLFVRKYDPLIHHRCSIRLKGYDYSKAGRYFVTICCQDRMCLFGRIENHEMTLNDAGKMIDKWFLEIPLKFPDIAVGAYVVMPNHFHGIIINTGIQPAVCGDAPVGADLCVRPENDCIRPENDCIRYDNDCIRNDNDCIRPENDCIRYDNDCIRNDNDCIRNDNDCIRYDIGGEHTAINPGEHVGSPLPRVVQWFKTMTTNEYIRGVKNLNWERFNGKLWQRNYYEHIIRDEKSFIAISNYIIANPANWNNDESHL
jgi:putative transposase